MADLHQSVLLSFAEYSNVCAIMVVVICLFCMVLFIVRLNTDQFSARVDPHPGMHIPSQAMRGVHNPFAFVLSQQHVSTLKDGAWFQMTNQVGCQIQAFWGVNIAELYAQIFLPWEQFLNQFESNELLYDISLSHGEKQSFASVEEQYLQVVPPGTVPDLCEQLEDPPRKRYPLVVLHVAHGDEDCITHDCVVSMVTILHLSDSKCPKQSHIISQFVRTPLGRPCNLQQLYMATSDGTNETSSSTEADSSFEENGDLSDLTDTSQTCIVCQTSAINRVLLPCRHACACDACFIRLNKCPMCRGWIHSSFQLQANEAVNQNLYSETTNILNTSRSPAWWIRLNQSIDEIFGFS